ncbi:high mobility group B protein 14 [Herrania umbratica]|uniref:High mobility group B protein 14 n=1 Tax=Herrania umbratica TaxID=108875 RepID=A0A6J1B4E3_9ROSI|nr:high mobility group B protein 14 [Herrania umbratica]
MAKKATKAKKSRSSSTSAASANNPSTPSNRKMVLRVKSSEKMKRSAQQSVVNEREKRPTSKSRPKSKQKKKNTRIDAKMPKKPPTAFFYFLEDFRKEFQEQNPDIKSMRDIGRACGEKWKTMTYEEKVKYYDIATEKRAEFDRAMAEYIKRKENGEDQDTEDDSEFGE